MQEFDYTPEHPNKAGIESVAEWLNKTTHLGIPWNNEPGLFNLEQLTGMKSVLQALMDPGIHSASIPFVDTPGGQFKDLMAANFLAGFPFTPCDNKIKLAKEAPFPDFHFNPFRMETIEGEPPTLFKTGRFLAVFLDGPAKDIFDWVPSFEQYWRVPLLEEPNIVLDLYNPFSIAPKQAVYKARRPPEDGVIVYKLYGID